MIKRDKYLNQLIDKKHNGLVKIITGIRRCGKSFLLFNIYKNYLLTLGVNSNNIIEIMLDDMKNVKYRNPFELNSYIRKTIKDNEERYYVLIDEIQYVKDVDNPYLEDNKVGFIDVLLGLMKIENVDIYVTGSNSRMLSSDILTEFKDRGDEVKVYPLTYKEFYDSYTGDKSLTWQEYFTYGGLPLVTTKKTHEEKANYLKSLFNKTYISDVIERNHLKDKTYVLNQLIDIVSSSVGSLTNPAKLAKTFDSLLNFSISPFTISNYLDYFIDAFILEKASRYDIKGKKYIASPFKYYFADIGLRNARLNFRQQEENHIMENLIYNELIFRGFDVDVGIVEINKKDSSNKSFRVQYEVDFVANKGSKRYYFQSAFMITSEEKRAQETQSLIKIKDSFKKIVIVKDNIIPWHDNNGVLYLGIERFLLDESVIDY